MKKISIFLFSLLSGRKWHYCWVDTYMLLIAVAILLIPLAYFLFIKWGIIIR